jgi:hypothetical protein
MILLLGNGQALALPVLAVLSLALARNHQVVQVVPSLVLQAPVPSLVLQALALNLAQAPQNPVLALQKAQALAQNPVLALQRVLALVLQGQRVSLLSTHYLNLNSITTSIVSE